MADTTTRRHPIRGFLYGIFFGLGLALIVIGQSWAALGTWPPFIVLVIGIVVGTLWATFGPARAPKGPPPAGATLADDPSPEPEPEGELEPAPLGVEPEPEGEAPIEDLAPPSSEDEAPGL